MDSDDMLAFGIMWSKTGDPYAGWELVAALGSSDSNLRQIARNVLIEGGGNAMALLEEAITAGILTPETAGPCMVELLRAGGSSACLTTEA